MTKVLVSGFEPYGATPVNPAQGVAEALDGVTIDDVEVTGIVASSRWFDCIDEVVGAVEETHPDVVIMLGASGMNRRRVHPATTSKSAAPRR